MIEFEMIEINMIKFNIIEFEMIKFNMIQLEMIVNQNVTLMKCIKQLNCQKITQKKYLLKNYNGP